MIYYPSCRVALRTNFEDEPTRFHLLDILPQYCKVELNSYQQADEFEVRIDYHLFPIDPRVIKSCGIGIWMGTTLRFGDLIEKNVDDCLITGFVDDFEIDLGEDGQILTLKGRDFTGILLDNKWFHGNIPLDLVLDDAIRWTLNHDPAFHNIKVVNKSGVPLPQLNNIKLREYEEHTPSDEDSYFDIIYDLCLQCGFICYIQLDELIINLSKNLFRKEDPAYFVYGHNLDKLTFKKNYAKQSGLNIEVKCYDPITKSTLTARYPDPPIQKNQMLVPTKNLSLNTQTIHTAPPKKASSKPKQVSESSSESKTYEFTSFIVSNIRSMDTLKQIAEGIWYQLYSKQIEGELQTADIEGFEGNTELLKLRNGNALMVTINEQFKQILNSMPFEQKMDFLIEKGFNPKVATSISQNIESLDHLFYTQKIRFEFHHQEGFSLGADFINYIEVK